MEAGETAALRVGAALAFGDAGSFSFPHVPPRADLLYVAHLLHFDPPPPSPLAPPARPRGSMTAEERIAAAGRHKDEGNAAFKAGELDEAMRQYEIALGYVSEDFMLQMYGKYVDLANAARLPCLLNTAACLLRLRRYDEAAEHCSMVLVEDGTSVKALFRRGKARAALGQSESARADLEAALKLAPGDAAVLSELRALRAQARQVADSQRALFSGMFGTPPGPRPPLSSALPWWRRLWLNLLAAFRTLLGLAEHQKTD
eukprot:SM000148S01048  [mRNA]  locus=s148:339120:340201:- [translate_table: standard]